MFVINQRAFANKYTVPSRVSRQHPHQFHSPLYVSHQLNHSFDFDFSENQSVHTQAGVKHTLNKECSIFVSKWVFSKLNSFQTTYIHFRGSKVFKKMSKIFYGSFFCFVLRHSVMWCTLEGDTNTKQESVT